MYDLLSKACVNEVCEGIALLFSLYFPPEPGGGASAAWNRAYILHKIGYSVFVICGFPSYPSGKVTDPVYKGKYFHVETMESFTVIRLRMPPLRYRGYLRRLVIFLNFVILTMVYMPRILRITGKIHLVYTMAPIIFSAFTGLVYSKLTKSIFVHEVSDIWPEELVIFKTNMWFIIGPVGKFFAKLSYIVPDVIIAISQLAAEYISQEYKPKVPVYVMPIGVDPNKFTRLEKFDSRNYLIRNNIFPADLGDKFVILYSGLISNATGVENIAFAAERLKNEHDIVFLIVGEGENKQNLEKLREKNSLINFYLLPFQSRNIMPRIISSADICVVSLPSEPIFDVDVPTKFYEYLASCKPLIGISQGELAEIINSRNIGRTVKAGDIDNFVKFIKELKSSPTMIKTMEENCHRTLQQFSLDSLASSFLNLLKMERIGQYDKK